MATQPEQPKLKNKRLNQGDRNDLYRFALKQIEATADTAAVDAAYELAADTIAKAASERWPQKDMVVLAKYEFAAPDPCIYVSTGGGDYREFNFRDGDKRIVLRPARYCNRQPLLLEGAAQEAFDAYDRAAKELGKANKARLNDFEALIYGNTSFNTLADIWPAVENMRESIVGTGSALQVLSADVVSRVKADPAFAATPEPAQ